MDDEPKLTPSDRARNARRQARSEGRKRVDVMLGVDASTALWFLRRDTGQSVKAIIERLLLAERERLLRR